MIDPEENKNNVKRLNEICNEAMEESYVGSKTHKIVKKGITLGSFFSGIVLGYAHGQGMNIALPAAASLSVMAMKSIYNFQMQIMNSNLIKEYIDKNTEIIRDKDKIRERYNSKIEELTQHEKNNLDLVQKSMTHNKITKTVDMGDFVFQDYFKSYQEGNEERMDKTLNMIARDGLIIDHLKLNPFIKTALYGIQHPKMKYLYGGLSIIGSSLVTGTGYGIGRGIAHFV
ncbi:hypothetical protein HN385_02615 [archaeon]|jgi:hypothetical protein|nr:hypothetical protein [archaeon]MBT3450643.1 hypothetical protein [archaeon]MBT6868777.1 hypothetical protein [archaeon]MBT7193002.1 hypothetical protein [archaeon]MBT7380968.1 hypothetical protein [archaeon]